MFRLSLRMLMAIAIGVAALVFILGAFSHAIHVLIGGESSYDPQARKEAVISAVVGLILAIILFLWLLWRCAG